jgi:hypothetical protein
VVVIFIIVVLAIVLFLLFSNRQTEKTDETLVSDTEMVDCTGSNDQACFIRRMNSCLPVSIAMTGSDNTTSIRITILGVENEKCHFQRKINDVLDLDCYFAKGTLNTDTLDQTFGNDKGLQAVVDEACKQTGW